VPVGARRVGLPEKEYLQPLEMFRAAVLYELIPRSKIRFGVSSCAARSRKPAW